MRPLAILAELAPWDPVAGTDVIVRLSSLDDARVTSLNGVAWVPGLDVSNLKLTLELFDPTFGGKASAGYGAIAFDLSAVPNAGRFVWGDKPARIYAGYAGDLWSSFDLVLDGITTYATAAGGRVDAPLRVADQWLDAPLLSTYEGTGGLEGAADLKGQAKPLALGAARFVEPVLVDAANNVYQYHAYGSAVGVTTLFDSLVAFAASIGDEPSYASLIAAPIPPGRFATCNARGLIRLGAPPRGVVTAHVSGDNASSDGFVRLPGAIAKRIALLAGASAAQLDTASLAALSSGVPYNCNRYLRDQVTVRGLLEELAGGLNAVVGVNWLGKLFFCRAYMGPAAFTLKTDGTTDPIVGEVALLEAGAPFWRMQLGASRVHRPHALSEIASYAPIEDRGDYDPATAYREGHQVRYTTNGKRYQYINLTPSTGNLPTDPLYWQQIETAPSASTLAGAVDFATQVGGGDKPAANATRNQLFRQSTDPAGTTTVVDGALWTDTSVTPNVEKKRIAGAWVTVANLTTAGSHVGVDDGATRNQIFRQSTDPTASTTVVNGALWTDTSVTPNVEKKRIGGAWVSVSNLTTAGSHVGVDNAATRNTATDELNRNPSFEIWDGGAALGWEIVSGAVALATPGTARRGGSVAQMGANVILLSEAFPVSPGQNLTLAAGLLTAVDDSAGAAPGATKWGLAISLANAEPGAGTAGTDNYYDLVPFGTAYTVANGYIAPSLPFTVPPILPSDSLPPRWAKLIAVHELGDPSSNGVGYLDYFEASPRQPASPFLEPRTGRPSRGRFLSTALLIGATSTVSATATAADAGASVTISIPNHVRKIVGASAGEGISYNAGTITGALFTTVYYIFCDDPDLAGGGVTYYATTDPDDLLVNGRYHVTTIPTPADGGASTGGNPGGGGGCVAVDMWIGDGMRAGDAAPGVRLLVLNAALNGVAEYAVSAVEFVEEPCLEIETASGCRLVCSYATPVTYRDGSSDRVANCLGRELPVSDLGVFRWEAVVALRPAGVRLVAHIHADMATYAAGAEPGRFILTHNPDKP